MAINFNKRGVLYDENDVQYPCRVGTRCRRTRRGDSRKANTVLDRRVWRRTDDTIRPRTLRNSCPSCVSETDELNIKHSRDNNNILTARCSRSPTHGAIYAKSASGIRPVDVQTGLLCVHDRIVLAFRSMAVTLAFLARSRTGLPRPLVVQRTTSVTPRATRIMKTIATGFL
jgi:hypothetical protein